MPDEAPMITAAGPCFTSVVSLRFVIAYTLLYISDCAIRPRSHLLYIGVCARYFRNFFPMTGRELSGRSFFTMKATSAISNSVLTSKAGSIGR